MGHAFKRPNLANIRTSLDVAAVFLRCAENRVARGAGAGAIMSIARANAACREAEDLLPEMPAEDPEVQALQEKAADIEASLRRLLASTQ